MSDPMEKLQKERSQKNDELKARMPAPVSVDITGKTVDPKKIDEHIMQTRALIMKLRQSLAQAESTLRTFVAIRQGMLNIYTDDNDEEAPTEE